MAGGKLSGIGAKLQMSDAGGTLRDLSDDVLDITIATPRGELDFTGLDAAGIELALGLGEAKITLTLVVNTAANRSHDVCKSIPSTAIPRTVTYTQPPGTSGAQQLSMVMLPTAYDVNNPGNRQAQGKVMLSLSNGVAPVWGTA